MAKNDPGNERRNARRWALLAAGLAAVVWWVWPASQAPAPSAPAVEPAPQAVIQPTRPRPARAEPPAGHTVEAGDEQALEESRTQTRLFGDARVKALYDNQTLRGVEITGVREGSFWERLGVRDGDVVLEVNGEPVDDPEASILLMNSLSRSEILSLRVRSLDGDERYLEYRMPR